MQQHKKYLIINTLSPTDGFCAEETLEFILSLASLEYEISILFLQNAVFQILTEQQLFTKIIEAFELFAIKNIYIEDLMLKKLQDLNLKISNYKNIKSFCLEHLHSLYNNHDIILWY